MSHSGIKRAACLFVLWSFPALSAGTARIDFTRDIRPIMADTCFRCHGFDATARKAGLRLDVREEAIKPAKSGARPIVPGNPDESEILRRMVSTDPDRIMPPGTLHKDLTEAQKDLFRRWIAEGAEYPAHWAFVKPREPAIPASGIGIRNPVDAFVKHRLAAQKLTASAEADRATLLRRVTLDLTGLPPTPSEQRAFLSDRTPLAYERLVDRLLDSPRFGERMAQDWLDVARYADSNGYQVDRDRDLWAWRDWVVNAFNRNQPFDQFTRDQLAGDLLEKPTFAQRVATGFNRNHMINEEGGIIPEEFLAEYCADRVETTATVWLGLTFNCARCHDHKYDPLTQKDYYGLYAFFHNVAEQGVGDYGAHYRHSTPPFLKLPTPGQDEKLARLKAELSQAEQELKQVADRLLENPTSWEKRAVSTSPSWTPLHWTSAEFALPADKAPETQMEDGAVRVRSGGTNVHLLKLEAAIPAGQWTGFQLDFENHPEGAGPETNRLSIHELRVKWPGTNQLVLRGRAFTNSAPAAESARAVDQNTNSAWQLHLSDGSRRTGTWDALATVTCSTESKLRVELVFSNRLPGHAWRMRLKSTDTPLELLLTPTVASLLQKPGEKRSAEERKELDEFRLAQSTEHVRRKDQAGQLRKQVADTDHTIPVTLVMSELEKPRETFALKRGAYDQKLESVKPATPASLPGMPPEFPRNRLGLARWLVDPAHPLTARVTVNRIWQSIFGTGLVRTPEDFGVQGEAPSHPDLLDWLAVEFVRTGWDMKRLVRLLVTSATYRQDSRVRPELLAADPENRWLGRGPRHRLSAEVIRDQALVFGGWMVDQLGGPPVKPYHPPGLYEQVVSGSSASTYVQDHGRSLYRRTLYTYWKRSVPNPALLLFDRPFRETCTVKRPRTSTPLQALNLMNDPTYVESARLLAERILRGEGLLSETRIRRAVRTVLAREASQGEVEVLLRGLSRMRRSFEADPDAALQLVSVGESKPDLSLGTINLAAYTTMACTLLNLDETITKE